MDPFQVPPTSAEYGAYYASYVERVPPGDARAILEAQGQELLALLRPLDEAASLARYAPGKWSIRELVGHLVDAERVFGGRLHHFARGNPAPLPGMDQNDYAKAGAFDARPWRSLLDEAEALRRADLAFFASLQPAWLDRGGEASGFPVTVRALLWILAGHERHHLDVLRSRYLG